MNLGVKINRSPEVIAEELIPDRNRKVNQGIEMPTYYKTSVDSLAQDAENAFLDAYADSKIGLTLRFSADQDPNFSPTNTDIVNMLELNGNSECPLKAQPVDISTHAPILQQGVDELTDTGIDASVYINATTTGRGIEEAIRKLEAEGLYVAINVDFDSIDASILSQYDADTGSFGKSEPRSREYSAKAERVDEILGNL